MLWYVIDVGVLRHVVGSRAVMAGQVDRVSQVLDLGRGQAGGDGRGTTRRSLAGEGPAAGHHLPAAKRLHRAAGPCDRVVREAGTASAPGRSPAPIGCPRVDDHYLRRVEPAAPRAR